MTLQPLAYCLHSGSETLRFAHFSLPYRLTVFLLFDSVKLHSFLELSNNARVSHEKVGLFELSCPFLLLLTVSHEYAHVGQSSLRRSRTIVIFSISLLWFSIFYLFKC